MTAPPFITRYNTIMKQLPSPAVYEKEFRYMPWGILARQVIALVAKQAPRNGKVLDLMCGPGYMLSKIQQLRTDVELCGVDIDKRYITYGRKQYSNIIFTAADVLLWKPKGRFYDVVVCTGGLHHIAYSKQERFLSKLSTLLKQDGTAIVADPYVRKYSNERTRRLAAAELGYEYLRAVINNGAPDGITSATIDIMYNDILPNGEYKTYTARIEKVLRKYFKIIKLHKTWPKEKSEYGDYYWVVSK
jgi:SAM-dependent methyltransferase